MGTGFLLQRNINIIMNIRLLLNMHRSSFVIKYQLCVLEPCYTGSRVLVLAMPGYCPGSFYTGVLAMGTGVMLPGY